MSIDPPTMPPKKGASLSNLRKYFTIALQQFTESPQKFQVLYSTSPIKSTPSHPLVKSLYVLDSSFNPPTLAHLAIARNALTKDRGAEPKRLLLLLATQNADKGKGADAPFEDRLVMMRGFAEEIHGDVSSDMGGKGSSVDVDVGVTKLPYFHDKAAAIEESGTYASDEDAQPQQIHLTGFDTIIRIFNTKYYPPTHTLEPLAPFLSRHRLSVTYRTGDQWGGKEEQDTYVRDIKEGKMESEGGKKEWADMIDLVDGLGGGVSSTRARRAVKEGDVDGLKHLVSDGVRNIILEEGLYS